MDKLREALVARINNYFQMGGVFNPEQMDHIKVQDLLKDCREFLAAPSEPTDKRLSREEKLEQALRGIMEIGKRDMSNPKYDGYFDTAREALAAPSEPQASEPTRFRKLGVMDGTDWKYDYQLDCCWIDGRKFVPLPSNIPMPTPEVAKPQASP